MGGKTKQIRDNLFVRSSFIGKNYVSARPAQSKLEFPPTPIIKPDRVIEYKGQIIRLYSLTKAAKILRVSMPTFKIWLSSGRIPGPLFQDGRAQYYTDYELSVFVEGWLCFGYPKKKTKIASTEFKNRTHAGLRSSYYREIILFIFINDRFEAIREDLAAGRKPSFPINLKFASESDLEAHLQVMLREEGIYSASLLKRLVAKFKDRQFPSYPDEHWFKKFYMSENREWLIYNARKIQMNPKLLAQFVELIAYKNFYQVEGAPSEEVDDTLAVAPDYLHI